MSSAHEALQRLLEDAPSVAAVCRKYSVRLLTAFGSALRAQTEPADLDLGVLFDDDGTVDVLGLRDSLVTLSGYEGIDLVLLNRAGPVIRERALVGAQILYEAGTSVHANAAIAAMMERMDTAWLRRLTLEALAK